jgi:hypothetical protein
LWFLLPFFVLSARTATLVRASQLQKGLLGLASWMAAGLTSEAWISPCFQRDAHIEVQLTIGLQADPEQFFAFLLSPCSQSFLGRTAFYEPERCGVARRPLLDHHLKR